MAFFYDYSRSGFHLIFNELLKIDYLSSTNYNKLNYSEVTRKLLKGLFLLAFIFIIVSCRTPKKSTDNSQQDHGAPPVPEIYDELPFGVPAFPDTIHYELPDGYVLRIFLEGDEHFHVAKTVDQFVIVMNQEGFYEYAAYDDQGLPQPTGIIARNSEDRTDDDWRILNSIKRNP
jgi:hypothetical protein